MRRAFGVALLILAVLIGAFGGLWAYMKSAGAEVDYCPGGATCTSGWYIAAALLAFAALAAVLGLALLRGEGNGSRSR